MPSRQRIYRTLEIDAKQAAQIRQALDAACEALKLPPPDTFLGRKSFEPFPREDEQEATKGFPPAKKK
jgi:hypothetical protein